MQLQIKQERRASIVAGSDRHGPGGNLSEVAEAPVQDVARVRSAIAGLVAVLLLICGLAALGAPSMVPAMMLGLSAMVAITAVFAGLFAASAAPKHQGAGLTRTDLEDKIELPEDLRWQARDNSDHLQALLDGQSDIILKRDSTGRMTFANRAFCSMFAVRLEDALGRPFHPEIIDRAGDTNQSGADAALLPAWARPSIEKIKVDGGARWIQWTHHWLEQPETMPDGIQSVGRDITEQRRHELALARARDEARAADRAKSRFLASMSHEIRTPMNGILGMSSLLNQTRQSPEQRTYTQAVRKSATTLLALIDEILDFSKVEAGHIELASKPVDIIDCVQGAVELLAPRAYQKQLQLAWSSAPDMPRQFLGDETRLRQILLNLLGNAVKFTESGGISVWVGSEPCESEYEEIKIVIRDSGPGLSAEACSRIFMEFERAVPVGTLQESGTGLGLAIAQRLAQCMGGGISVASKFGDGATFTLCVRLPRVDADRPVASSASVEQLSQRQVVIVSSQNVERRTIANFLRAHNIAVTELNVIEDLADWSGDATPDTVLLDFNVDPHAARRVLDALAGTGTADITAAVIAPTGYRAEFERFSTAGIENFLVRPIRPATLLALLAGEVDKPAATAASKPSADLVHAKGANWRVLVAEDNEINALLTRTVLTRLGCTPVMVPNGREAIDEVARSLRGDVPRLDAILMDLHMPVIDGLEATASIRRLCEAEGAPHPVIIAVTANAFQEDRERCLAAGMDDYLSKPFEPGDLQRVLAGISTKAAD